MNAEEWINKLELQEHPEGGFYKETYRSEKTIDNRQLATSIYFLLRHFEVSHFHRIKSDEIWYHHYGNTFEIHMLHEDGSFSVIEYDNTGTITTTQTYNVATGLSNPLLAGIIAVKKGVIVGSNSSSK